MSESKYTPVPPFEVGILDKFHAFDDKGYDKVAEFETLAEAVAEADRITRESEDESGDAGTWSQFGSVGLVYDAKGKLLYTGERGYVLDIDRA
jgi:hypothetical protein